MAVAEIRNGFKLEGPQGPERFCDREIFNQSLRSFLDILGEGHKSLPLTVETWLHESESFLSASETALLRSFWELFQMRMGLGATLPENRDFLIQGGVKERIVLESAGPMAVGKTTAIQHVASEIGAQMVVEAYEEDANPFLAGAYKDSSLMLRTQLKFLSDNIRLGLKMVYQTGRFARDTSLFSDIYVFMEWRRRAGKVTEEEHQMYQEAVSLLEPLIIKPSLLAVFLPTSLERLWEGLQARIEGDSQNREMEKAVTKEDLAIVCQAAEDAIPILAQKGVPLVVLHVDPVEMFKHPEVRYASIFSVQEKLGLLKEMIQPQPEVIVNDILTFFVRKKGRLYYLYSPSMFTGKTTILLKVKEAVEKYEEEMLIFRPGKSMRWDETGEEIKSRDGLSAAAVTIESNNFADILSYIQKKHISPQKVPVLGIDEAMLFANSAQEVVQGLDWLRNVGFNIVFTGLGLNFKGEAFSFMDTVMFWALHDSEAKVQMVTTRCRYCEQRASVSRLCKNGALADYGDDQVFIGDPEFEPVCGDKHLSCEGRPTPFDGVERNVMPKNPQEYLKILKEAGVIA